MNLKITKMKYKDRKQAVKRLYRIAFPKVEQLPWWILRFLSVRKGIDFLCFYDENDFCGFTYTVSRKSILFVLFFAVEEKMRGKGCGSAILNHLKKAYPTQKIVLNIEPLDPNSENADERVKRFEFYKKNGFFDTEYMIDEIGGSFRVLSTESTLNVKEYKRIFKKMSFGFWNAKITKA